MIIRDKDVFEYGNLGYYVRNETYSKTTWSIWKIGSHFLRKRFKLIPKNSATQRFFVANYSYK